MSTTMLQMNAFVSGYDAAADHYDSRANRYRDRFSRRTLRRLAPRAGDRILDVGCGTGAFAIPAAAAVGPGGLVTAVDLSASLLELARRKASERRLPNITFECRDFLSVSRPEIGYDAVVSVFSLYLAPCPTTAARHLWNLVRPGGALAVTSWGVDLFEPATSLFWHSIAKCRPELGRPRSPWDRLSDPAALRALLLRCDPSDVCVVYERGEHALGTPGDWWDIVLGSGFRTTVEQLSPAERDSVRRDTVEHLRAAEIRTIRVDTVYGIARKPAG